MGRRRGGRSNSRTDDLLKFTSGLLTSDPAMCSLVRKSGLSEDRLKVIAIMVAYSIRAYDAVKEGGKLTLG